jgi:hypothetical protein
MRPFLFDLSPVRVNDGATDAACCQPAELPFWSILAGKPEWAK